jgi:hypothetical protein
MDLQSLAFLQCARMSYRFSVMLFLVVEVVVKIIDRKEGTTPTTFSALTRISARPENSWRGCAFTSFSILEN